MIARTRIGRVRMKAGGADVRVIHTEAADTKCRDKVRSWAANVLSAEDHPHAFFAIAFRWGGADFPSSFDTTSSWESDHFALPIEMLPTYAALAIRRQIISATAEAQIMRNLGYERDEPDAPA